MGSNKFSAGPSALGFLYQVQYALYALLKEDREEAKLVIEGLDDISIEGDKYVELSQLKHHIRKQATMSAASPELWKTIGIWSTHLKAGKWKPHETKLTLITTARATAGSLPTLLADEGRDPVEAHRILVETSGTLCTPGTSTNQSLQSSFEAFQKLSQTEQMELVDALYIYSESPHIHDIPALIKRKQLYWVTPINKIDLIYDQLQAWWFNRAVLQLIGKSTQKIAKSDVRLQLEEIVSQYQRDSLPIHYRTAKVDGEYVELQRDKMFVQQLKDIEVNTRRIHNAVQDYYRAFEQRTRWVNEELLIDDDLHQYENILQDEWDHYVTQLIDDLGDPCDMDDVNCVKFGKMVLNWMENARIPIRTNLPVGGEYVMRGSYHMLADAELPQLPPVYWHPKFREKLEQALATHS